MPRKPVRTLPFGQVFVYTDAMTNTPSLADVPYGTPPEHGAVFHTSICPHCMGLVAVRPKLGNQDKVRHLATHVPTIPDVRVLVELANMDWAGVR